MKSRAITLFITSFAGSVAQEAKTLINIDVIYVPKRHSLAEET